MVKIGSREETIYPLELNQSEFNTDLLPLKTAFADKEIVGMGEATHGTKEFFDLKSKTFKFLVTNCNYKVFGIEASYGECSFINDYVNSGIGNIDTVMDHFDFWTWRTEEVKELILWIKNYNQQKSESEKISFYGFDMQSFYSPIQYLNFFFMSDTSINYNELKNIINPILTKSEAQIYKALKNKKNKFQDTLTSVHYLLKAWINKNKPIIEFQYSAKQLERLLLSIENYGQSIKEIDGNYRDSCMASNVLKIQKIENAKMFIWAHNGHINLSYSDNSYKYSKSQFNDLPMGAHIRNAIGTKYHTIGFVFNEGHFQAFQNSKIRECSVPVNKKNTLTNALSSTKSSVFYVNLTSSDNVLFSTAQRMYDIGAVFWGYKKSSAWINAKKQFDGLIYIEKTTRAIPI